MKKIFSFIIVIVGVLSPTMIVSSQNKDVEDLKRAIQKASKIPEYLGSVYKEIPVYQCRDQWLSDSLAHYVKEKKKRYSYMETDFGKRDTFYLEMHGVVNHFHYCTFFMDVFTGFEADNDSVCISHELDMITGCLKLDSLFFLFKGLPPSTYFYRTDEIYKNNILIRTPLHSNIDLLSYWSIFLYEDPRKHMIIKHYTFDYIKEKR